MKPWSEMADDEKEEMLDWVKRTCLLFGSTRKTAYLVASTFGDGLDRLIETFVPNPEAPR